MEEEEGAGARLREGSGTRTRRKEARASHVDEEAYVSALASTGTRRRMRRLGNQRD